MDGFHKWGVPPKLGGLWWKIKKKRMMTGGTPTLGNPLIWVNRLRNYASNELMGNHQSTTDFWINLSMILHHPKVAMVIEGSSTAFDFGAPKCSNKPRCRGCLGTQILWISMELFSQPIFWRDPRCSKGYCLSPNSGDFICHMFHVFLTSMHQKCRHDLVRSFSQRSTT